MFEFEDLSVLGGEREGISMIKIPLNDTICKDDKLLLLNGVGIASIM